MDTNRPARAQQQLVDAVSAKRMTVRDLPGFHDGPYHEDFDPGPVPILERTVPQPGEPDQSDAKTVSSPT